MNILDQNLKQSLIKGYISEKEESKLELLPEFLTNDADSNQKVLTTIIKELQYNIKHNITKQKCYNCKNTLY